MSATQLQTAIIDGAIRSINFFNGRLLSARDLTLEQSAYREADRRLGKAIGDGIAYGLEVSKPSTFKKEAPTLTVDAGLGINRLGQTLMLRARTDVALVRDSTWQGTPAAFSDCLPLQTGAYVAGAGVYLLTIAPAQASEGRAVTNTINPAATTCNTDTIVSAVQFRLIELDSALSTTELNDQKHLRNLLAYKCFGVTEQAAFVKDLLGGEWKKYGLLDGFRSNQLTDCEVPLAVLYWTDEDGVNFVDNWSVRRPLVRYLVAKHEPASLDETTPVSNDAMVFASRLAPFTDERRRAEGLAMLLQFEEQLFALLNSLANPQNFIGTEAFGFLPPAGVVPMRNAPHPQGFAYEKFFLNKSFAPPTAISGAKLNELLAESLHYPPINLSGAQRIQLYTVTENTQAQSSPNPPQPYLVFASQQLPYYSEEPRFADLCQTLRECRDAYHALLTKDTFFSELVIATMPARLRVQAAIQYVAQLASERQMAICKCNCAVDFQKALDTLQDLYVAQKDLVATFSIKWPGIADLTSLQTFASQLSTLLDTAIPGGRPSLHQAIINGSLKAAIEAQNFIDGMVFGYTGGGGVTTSGNIDVEFDSAKKGTQLVIGSTDSFEFVFAVSNQTNHSQKIDLVAEFLAPHTLFNQNVTVSDMAGNPISFVTLEPGLGNPNAPGSSQLVKVSVVTPPGATITDKPVLRLTGNVPPPVERMDFDLIPLTVGNQGGPSVDNFVRFSTNSPVHTRAFDQGQVDTKMTLRYDARFHASANPQTRAFRFHILVSSTATRQFYTLGFDDRLVNTASAASTSMDIFTENFNLTSDQEEHITLKITPRTSTPPTKTLPGPLTFTVRLHSVDDPNLKVEHGPITITTTS